MKRSYYWIAISVIAISLVSCTKNEVTGDSVAGRVVNQDTKQPVEGAYVQVRWQGTVSNLIHSADLCLHEAIAVTDIDGRFFMPAWSRPPTAAEQSASAIRDVLIFRRIFKPSYMFYWESRLKRDQAMLPFFVKRSTEDSWERLKQLSDFRDDCIYDGSQKSTIPMLQAILEESRRIPESDRIPTHPIVGQDFLRNLPRDIQVYACQVRGEETIPQCISKY